MLACSTSGVLLVACAAGTRQTSISNEPARPEWSGSLQPTQQRSGALTVTGQTRAFGTVRLFPAEGTNYQRMHVALTVGLPISSSASVRWAVLPNRCGSGDLPLIGFEQFPLIEISNNGRGQIETDLPLDLTAGGAYHVNIYTGGQGLENVVTCANLRYDESLQKR